MADLVAQNTPRRPAPSKRSLGYRLAQFFYRLAWRGITPLIGPYLKRRVARGKEDGSRLLERRGISDVARPEGPLVQVHGASVGESLSALPLLEKLLERDPSLSVLVTTGTVTSADVLKSRLPDRAFHQFIPLDHPGYVRGFLDHWRPDLILWLESEFWPGFLESAASRGIPTALLNARLSDASFEKWSKRPGLIGPILTNFRVALAQDDAVADKLQRLGATHALAAGNLKFAAPPLPDDAEKRAALEKLFEGRSLLLAAQTAEGEEEAMGRIQLHLRTKCPNLLTIIAPRHPNRAEEIREGLEAQGLLVAQRSLGDLIAPETDIYLADTMGELGLFYRLGAPVFLGRSLVPGHGGSNPLEPAQLGCAVVQGPYTENFSSTTNLLGVGDGFIEAGDDLALCDALDLLLTDEEARRAQAARGETRARSGADVLDTFLDALEPLLPHAATKGGAP